MQKDAAPAADSSNEADPEQADLLSSTAPKSEAKEHGSGAPLALGGPLDVYSASGIGYLAQYFCVGLIYGGLPATVYGFFLGYLNVPAHVYATVHVIMTLPWSFKFAFGLLNDCAPIGGYRRKPYMVIGWAICCAVLLHLAAKPLPEPYWCRDPDTGAYITKVTKSDGSHGAAKPCNAHAAKEGGAFALLMMCAALGYVVADVAADGLTVQYARREPQKERGDADARVRRAQFGRRAIRPRAILRARAILQRRLQHHRRRYLTRTFGQVAAVCLVGFGMNGREYNGTFRQGLSFSAVCFILAIPAGLMVPLSWMAIEEEKVLTRDSLRGYLRMSWGYGTRLRPGGTAAAVARLLLRGALPVPHAGDLRRVDDGGRPRQELLGRRPEFAEPDLLARRPRALRRRAWRSCAPSSSTSRGG